MFDVLQSLALDPAELTNGRLVRFRAIVASAGGSQRHWLSVSASPAINSGGRLMNRKHVPAPNAQRAPGMMA